MAADENEPVQTIRINYYGYFKMDTLTYGGGALLTFNGYDFNKTTVKEFYHKVEDVLDLVCRNMYYCLPDKGIRDGGLKYLTNDKDMRKLVKLATKTTVDVFLDHNDVDMSEYIEDDPVSDEENDENSGNGNEENSGNGNSDDKFQDAEEDEEEGPNMEPFENVDDTDGFVEMDEEDKQKLEEYNKNNPVHDPNIHWRAMRPRKGERFANIDQFKTCITNYAVSNGFKLYFLVSKKDVVLVKCGIRLPEKRKEPIPQTEPSCPFRLWGTKIGNE